MNDTEHKPQTPESAKNPLGKIRISNAIYPILIGLGVVGYMFWKDFDKEVFAGISFTWHTVFWLFMAVLFMFGRDIGYIIRIRILSNNQLSWYQAFRVIMLWEFTSAITPSAVGGTSVAIIYVHKEGISVGRSSAIVMLTGQFIYTTSGGANSIDRLGAQVISGVGFLGVGTILVTDHNRVRGLTTAASLSTNVTSAKVIG